MLRVGCSPHEPKYHWASSSQIEICHADLRLDVPTNEMAEKLPIPIEDLDNDIQALIEALLATLDDYV